MIVGAGKGYSTAEYNQKWQNGRSQTRLDAVCFCSTEDFPKGLARWYAVLQSVWHINLFTLSICTLKAKGKDIYQLAKNLE